jgi:hypothetical protein
MIFGFDTVLASLTAIVTYLFLYKVLFSDFAEWFRLLKTVIVFGILESLFDGFSGSAEGHLRMLIWIVSGLFSGALVFLALRSL